MPCFNPDPAPWFPHILHLAQEAAALSGQGAKAAVLTVEVGSDAKAIKVRVHVCMMGGPVWITHMYRFEPLPLPLLIKVRVYVCMMGGPVLTGSPVCTVSNPFLSISLSRCVLRLMGKPVLKTRLSAHI